MADCPKCNKHLRLTDWKQYCPYCGANIVLYNIQERLMLDADKAELQYYYNHKKIERMKAAFIGSKLAIVRIVTSILPVLAILLPFGHGIFTEPFYPLDGEFGLFTLLDVSKRINLSSIFSLLETPDGRLPMILLISSIAVFLLSIVTLLIRFVCLTMACSPKGKLRNYTFDILLLVMCEVGILLILVIPENPYFNIYDLFAPDIYRILLFVNYIVDVDIFKKGIEVKYEECFVGGIPAEEYLKMKKDGVPQEEIRKEMYKILSEQQAKEAKKE